MLPGCCAGCRLLQVPFALLATAYRRKRIMEGLISGDREVMQQVRPTAVLASQIGLWYGLTHHVAHDVSHSVCCDSHTLVSCLPRDPTANQQWWLVCM